MFQPVLRNGVLWVVVNRIVDGMPAHQLQIINRRHPVSPVLRISGREYTPSTTHGSREYSAVPGDLMHIEPEDVPWAINIPDHAERDASATFVAARKVGHQIPANRENAADG